MMPEVLLDLAKPFFLVEIYDKDSNDLKYTWSPNIFSDSERPEDDTKIASETYIEDIEIKSNFEPPINTGEVKINHEIGKTPKILIKDQLKIYFGYYTLANSQTPVYSLAYTGQIDFIKASLNNTSIKSSSKIKKITESKRELAFSKIMTITDIIKKLAIEDGGLEEAPNGITDTTISKQKGFAISKNLSVYKHLKKLADLVGFDIYMDSFDKFNAREWSPEPAPNSSSEQPRAINWIIDRNDSENDVQKQLLHPIYFGVNAKNMELNIEPPGPSKVEIVTLADSEGSEVLTIEPPTGTSGDSDFADKVVLPRFTKEDADKIAEALIDSGGFSGDVTLIGSPQIRLGDGIKLYGHIHGKPPFHEINIPTSEFDASYTGQQENPEESGEGEASSSSGSGSTAEEKLFKVTGLKHLFNDKLGFITKLNLVESVPVEPEEEGESEEEEEKEGIEEEEAFQFELNVQISRSDPKAKDDTVTLTRDDGGYEQTLKVHEGTSTGAGSTDLVFTNIPKDSIGKKFTCEIDQGAGGNKYYLFEAITLFE